MKIKYLMAYLILPITITSCSSEVNETGENPVTPPTKREIKISTNVSGITRATDTGFDTNDKCGLYVVNRGIDNSSSALKATGNHVDNMRFTYSGTWTPDTPIYWMDNTTHADFYLYFPYQSGISDVNAMSFSVKTDQSSETAYKASELLIGSVKDMAPTKSAVVINVKHVLSQMIVNVAAGNGFTTESLAAANVGVTINGTKVSATLDIATSAVSATGDAQSIKPWNNDGAWKALVIPQSVEEINLITVNVDGKDYNLKKAFTFVSGKSHKFTVTVSKTSNGINVNIDKWETDDTDNGGVAE